MTKKYKVVGLLAIVAIIGVVSKWYFHKYPMIVLDPKGTVGLQERHLMWIATLLGLCVVIPVITLAFVIAWRYRDTNHRAHYEPNWDGNRALELTWWLIPMIIICILSRVTWTSTHQLDPFKPLASKTPALNIQVIALDWKWLFIYPEQNIATVNALEFPVNTPVDFTITSDGPMNSFWIPQLGGQIYAMAGMSTQLHLSAYQTGDYRGSSANISGSGFAGMHFTTKVRSKGDFDAWVKQVKHSPQSLTLAAYDKLAQPSQNNPPTYYGSKADNLYTIVVDKYMTPPGESQTEGNQ